jgi:hypothetical protein
LLGRQTWMIHLKVQKSINVHQVLSDRAWCKEVQN